MSVYSAKNRFFGWKTSFEAKKSLMCQSDPKKNPKNAKKRVFQIFQKIAITPDLVKMTIVKFKNPIKNLSANESKRLT